MALARKASLVVTMSISAVETLKDQLGICRWNYILSNVSRHAMNRIAMSSGQFQQVPTTAAAIAVEQIDCGVSTAEEMMRRRKTEKAEKVMNLVCWVPN